MRKTIVIGILSIFALACEEPEDPRDPIPYIEVVSISPSIIKEFQDSVVIVLEYHDGDGDLGGIPADDANLFVVDRRINVPFEFRIQELVPGGVEVPITGRLNLTIQNLFITDGGNQQQVDFEIYAFDRAGNESNHEITQKILITKN